MNSEKIKIMFFCPSLSRGGAEKHFARLIQNLSSDRYEKILVTSRSENQYIDIINQDQIRVITLDINCNSSIRALILSINPLIKLVEYEKPQVLVSVMDMVNFITWIVKKKSNHPFKSVYLVQASLLQAIKFQSNLLKKILYKIMPKIYKNADKVIVLSDGVKKEITEKIRNTGDNIITIHNIGVTDITEVEKQFFIRKAKSIICIGRLVKLKGFDLVIRAMSDIVKKFPESNLTFLGSGPEEEKLKSITKQLKLENNIHFKGMVPNPEFYLNKTEVFILASYLEGFGNVIIEAMASGCAVIATDCPHGPSEIIEHNKNGILVPIDNPGAIRAAIEELFLNPYKIRSIANRGYERALDFTPQKIADQYEEAILSIL
ncbi:hypothetical protein C9994_10100 [Marivirga lumbricoides]|uniref:Glycosyltransferase n=1 Tax=Marivirga lumbricoides TaxID=1046115 RepID=A0A2T4DPS8_9BACT|nr:hypothetical protein C9994_10100 [Marivirga lumbricoides]